MTFREFLRTITPAWLLDATGQALSNGLATPLDELLMRLKDGIKAKLPALAARDALGAIAFERMLPRGANETDAAWAARLQAAWDIWYWAGSAYGVLRALYTAGYAPQLIIGQGTEYELDTATGTTLTTNNWGGPYDFTGNGPSYWNAFIVYFPTARWPTAWTTAGAPPAQASDEAQTLMATVARWKPAWTTFAKVSIQGSTGGFWGIPPGTAWAASGRTWGAGNSVVWTPPST